MFLEKKLMEAEVAIVKCEGDPLERRPFTGKRLACIQSCACRQR